MAELAERAEKLARMILEAAKNARSMDSDDLVLFVRLGTRIAKEDLVFKTYDVVKSRVAVDGSLRRNLWAPIEKYLVENRRYREVAGEQAVGSAIVDYYLQALEKITISDESRDPILRVATEYTIRTEGGIHFEALLGAGAETAAMDFADRLIQFRPTTHTFAVLIRHARRAGALDVATALRTRALRLVPEADRVAIEGAFSESPIDQDASCSPAPPR
jgi:hypothetical protein